MTSAMDLLRAPEYGVKEFKSHISQTIKTKKPIVLRGKSSKKVLLEYDEVLELIELIEDLKDNALLQSLASGKTAIDRGEAIDAEESIRRLREESSET